MTQNYEMSFYDLLDEIHRSRPNTASRLQQIKEVCSAQVACYAAVILVYLNSWHEVPGKKPLEELTPADLKDFTFFEAAKENPSVLALFEELLDTYKTETPAVRQDAQSDSDKTNSSMQQFGRV